MSKIRKFIRQHYLTVIAVILLIIAIYGTVNYYLKEMGLISYHKMTDVRGLFFEISLFQGAYLMFLPPLAIMLIVIDNWHNKFKNGNIKNYLTRQSYKHFRKKLFLSIAKTALIYPLILLIFLGLSFILAKGGNDYAAVIENSLNYGDYTWAYHHFFLYIIRSALLLYIQGLMVSFFPLVFLNKVKNKVLIILFSYITWIVSILLLYAFPSMLLDIYFNYKINNAYLNYYSFLMYYNLDIDYYLYLFSLSCFTVFLFFINYFLIYGKKEKVVLQNEKEMV